MNRRHQLVTVVAVLALALLASGCRSEAEDALLDSTVIQGAIDSTSPTSSSSSTTTTTSSTTTTTVVLDSGSEPSHAEFPEPTDGEVFDEYIAGQLEGWAAALRAATEQPSLTPEADHPDMARFAGEEYLKINHELVRSFVEKNWVAQEPEESVVGRTVGEKNRISGVQRIDGETVDVFRCIVEDEDIVDATTGEVEISGVVTVLLVVTMKRFDDGWKAVFSEVSQKIEGVAGCFLASDIEFPY